MQQPNLPAVSPVGKKTKAFTTRQLNRGRRRDRLQAKADLKAEKAQARALERRYRRATSVFRGCDIERTLELLGVDA
jgi:hypothetical protein